MNGFRVRVPGLPQKNVEVLFRIKYFTSYIRVFPLIGHVFICRVFVEYTFLPNYPNWYRCWPKTPVLKNTSWFESLVGHIMKTLRFIKLSDRWFIDIPWIGDVNDLQMVDGAGENLLDTVIYYIGQDLENK